jgi:DNA-binding response OmpR family regulator
MMTLQRTVLLVTASPSRAQAMASAIRRLGHRALVATSFDAARQQLPAAAPHLLVTDLKLGAYNGLHLALRAAASEIPAIVMADPSFEGEVEQLGAVWLPDTADGDELQAAALRLLQGARASQVALGWPDEESANPAAFTDWQPGGSEIRH